MNATLYHQLFRAVDALPAELLDSPERLRGLLEQEVESAGGYWSSQVEEYVTMLLDEFCMAGNRAA